MSEPRRKRIGLWVLGGAMAFSGVSCGDAPVRPDPPSTPPLTTARPGSTTSPAAEEDARPAPEPVPAVDSHDVAQPTPAMRQVSERAQSDENVEEDGSDKPKSVGPEPPNQVDPLQWMADRAAREEARKVRIAEAEKALFDARERVGELEKRLLAVKNPFLPRPVLPPDEAKAWEGLSGAERAARVEAQLKEAREAVVETEATLAELKSR